MTGAEILIASLLKENVKIVFGIPGGSILPIFDELYNVKDKIKFILTRHEQAAGHMADGYARATGKVGVCLVTSGPGASNLTTALATAYMDSIPIVAFTGQVATDLIGNDAFQESDVASIVRSVTKHNFSIKDIKDLANSIKQAFYIAKTGRPGPVVIDIPIDIQKKSYKFIWPKDVNIPSYSPHHKPPIEQIKRAAELINSAKKPLIYAGGGVIASKGSNEIKLLAEKIDSPVTTTLMALGIIDHEHPLNLRMPGTYGNKCANTAFQNADVIIAIGARFDDRVTANVKKFAPQAKIIHVDIDPTSIAKNVKVNIPIVGDAREITAKLIKEVKKNQHKKWLDILDKYKNTKDLKTDKITPKNIIEEISSLTKREAIIVTDVGQNQIWAAHFYKHKYPRHFLSSGGEGTMGFGLPAAIGAKIACLNKTVILITGDGSFQMNMQELSTIAVNKIDIKIFIMNNNSLGMVKQLQQLFFKKRYIGVNLSSSSGSYEDKNSFVLDFCKLAQVYNIANIKLEKLQDMKKVINQALKTKGSVIVDCIINPDENVYPIVPPGASLNETTEGI